MGVKQRYQVIEKIDAGGMAEIFKGRALSLDGIEKPVAIKRILPSLASNRKFLQMFIDEARLSMRLSHANIVQVFDVGRADDTYFLVMEFIDGSNVRRILQKAQEVGYKIPVPVAVHIIMEICRALSHAHEATDNTDTPLGIVHRDVSPPNILVSWSGEAKITDFGLAKAVSQLERTEPGVVKGKFSYLSPEACDGKTVDARADLFGLGIILHELLTNRRLFMGKSDMETVELVRKCQVPNPSALNPEVPEALDSIILKVLAKDRKRRYQSGREFGDALANFLFSHSMKVTAYDVARTMRELFDRVDDDGNYEERVQEMIREEVLSLSMMGVLESTTAQGRSEPIDLAQIEDGRGHLEEIWTDYDQAEPSGERDEPSSLARLMPGKEPEIITPSPGRPGTDPGKKAEDTKIQKKKGGAGKKVAFLLLFLLAALAGGAAWLYLSGELLPLLSELGLF